MLVFSDLLAMQYDFRGLYCQKSFNVLGVGWLGCGPHMLQHIAL